MLNGLSCAARNGFDRFVGCLLARCIHIFAELYFCDGASAVEARAGCCHHAAKNSLLRTGCGQCFCAQGQMWLKQKSAERDRCTLRWQPIKLTHSQMGCQDTHLLYTAPCCNHATACHRCRLSHWPSAYCVLQCKLAANSLLNLPAFPVLQQTQR